MQQLEIQLLFFPLLSHVQIILWAISLDCYLKFPNSFSSYFYHLHFCLFFSCLSRSYFFWYWCYWLLWLIFLHTFQVPESSMLVRPLPPSFLDNLSMTLLRCKALRNIIDSLVSWFIYLSFSLIHFKKKPEYLTRETILWWDFCCWVWFQEVFLSWYLLSWCFLSSMFAWWYLLLIFSDICSFLFLVILSWPSSSIPWIAFLISFFIISTEDFSIPNSVTISWLYIVMICIKVSSSFSNLENNVISSI